MRTHEIFIVIKMIRFIIIIIIYYNYIIKFYFKLAINMENNHKKFLIRIFLIFEYASYFLNTNAINYDEILHLRHQINQIMFT